MPFFLPDCHDLYSVGATTFVTPVRPSRTYGSARFPNGQPALVLDEVAFTAYYPANRADKAWKSKRGINWLNRPLNETWRGFVNFARGPLYNSFYATRLFLYRKLSIMASVAFCVLLRSVYQGTRVIVLS